MFTDHLIRIPKEGYKFCKKMNKRANPISTFYYLINSLVMIICMDKIEKYIRLNIGFEVVDDIRKYFKERVYNTIIPRLIRLTEAPSHGKPIVVYDPKSKGTEAYLNLAKEVIERNGAS